MYQNMKSSKKVDIYLNGFWLLTCSLRSFFLIGILTGGRSYIITSKTNTLSKFSIRNELFNIGKKLFFLQDGEERFIVRSF